MADHKKGQMNIKTVTNTTTRPLFRRRLVVLAKETVVTKAW
jgi:hypothetical protein